MDGFVVKQKKDYAEVITGFEQENIYNVFNKDGQQVKISKVKIINLKSRFM